MKKLINTLVVRYNLKKDRGYTLLEYCIGAAALGAIIFAATQALGGGIQAYLTNLGNWFSGQGMPN